MNPREIKGIIRSIPKECNPRLGGFCNLYFRGLVDSYRNIDIIVNKNTIDKVNLPYPRIESYPGEGWSKRIKYCINSREVVILENVCPITKLEMSLLGIYFETEDNVLYAERLREEYIESLQYSKKT